MPNETTHRETGWLIELKPSVSGRPAWWAFCRSGELDWSHDHMEAIRYARKIDADRVITSYGWTEAFSCEHAWDIAPARKISMILGKDAAGQWALWACRGEGKGCQRNKFRAKAAVCDDCKGPLDPNMTIEEVERQLAQGDA